MNLYYFFVFIRLAFNTVGKTGHKINNIWDLLQWDLPVYWISVDFCGFLEWRWRESPLAFYLSSGIPSVGLGPPANGGWCGNIISWHNQGWGVVGAAVWQHVEGHTFPIHVVESFEQDGPLCVLRGAMQDQLQHHRDALCIYDEIHNVEHENLTKNHRRGKQ